MYISDQQLKLTIIRHKRKNRDFWTDTKSIILWKLTISTVILPMSTGISHLWIVFPPLKEFFSRVALVKIIHWTRINFIILWLRVQHWFTIISRVWVAIQYGRLDIYTKAMQPFRPKFWNASFFLTKWGLLLELVSKSFED